METENIVRVENISVKIKDALILQNITLDFQAGNIYGLVGRNGSGKTMLMKAICGFVPVTEGKITVFGKVIGKKNQFAENMGFIIETPGFLPNYTAYQNLAFLSSINGKIDKKRIYAMLEQVGLGSAGQKKVGKFSLGMNQRLGLAQALIEDPDLLILDEPFNGLDNDGVKQIRSLLMELRDNGKTIIMASHTQEDIDVLCDKVYKMDKGKILDTDVV